MILGYACFIIITGLVLRYYQVKNFENEGNVHPFYSKTECGKKCLKEDDYYFSDQGWATMVPFAYFMFLYGYMAWNKGPICVENQKFWKMTWKSKAVFFKRILVYVLSLSPIMILYILTIGIGQTMLSYAIAWPLIILMSYILIKLVVPMTKYFNIAIAGDVFYLPPNKEIMVKRSVLK